MSRLSSLNQLINFTKPLSVVTTELSTYDWDIDSPLVELKVEHVTSVLAQYLSGIFSAAQVEGWANAIECREDIRLDPDSCAGQAIRELGNPLLTQPLSRQSAQAWVARLATVAT
jgi:hypothetical protein